MLTFGVDEETGVQMTYNDVAIFVQARQFTVQRVNNNICKGQV